jgi:hypothetical protein
MTRAPQLQEWEVAIIRAMLNSGRFTKQQIVSYFSRPARSINQGRISEIEDDHERYRGIASASYDELQQFLDDWESIRFPSEPIVEYGPTHPRTLQELFALRRGQPLRLSVSETSIVEGKQSFNWGSQAEYCKTLAGMANNKGGYLLFGVQDGSFEIVGIAADRMERFDLRRANEYVSRTFNQAFDIEKGQFEIRGMTIGALYVYASKEKPVICKVDSGGLCSGDVFYRYPGETRRIQAPELEKLLRERDAVAEGRFLGMAAKINEAGVHNAAVLNLTTGEVDGEKGRFVIDETLLDRIKFVAQGRFKDVEGAPALRLIGDVQPVTAGVQAVERLIVGAITERHIQEAFLSQTCRFPAEAYISAQTHIQPLWLPIFFFAMQGNLNLDQVVSVLRNSGSPYAERVERQVERVTSGRAPAGVPAEASVQDELNALRGNEPIEILDEAVARRYLQALRILAPDETGFDRAFELLRQLYERFGNMRELRGDFRYTLADLDLKWFRPAVTAGQNPAVAAVAIA